MDPLVQQLVLQQGEMTQLIEKLVQVSQSVGNGRSKNSSKQLEKQTDMLLKQQKQQSSHTDQDARIKYFKKILSEQKESEQQIKQTVSILQEKQAKKDRKQKKKKIINCHECSETFDSKREAKLHTLEKHAANDFQQQQQQESFRESVDFNLDLASEISPQLELNSAEAEQEKPLKKPGPTPGPKKIKKVMNPAIEILDDD